MILWRGVLLLGLPLGFLIVIGTAASVCYVDVMYDARWDGPSTTEAVSFAVQTLTTVGYGNWEAPAMGELPDKSRRVLSMRKWSIFWMLAGATFYSLFTGVLGSLVILGLQPQLLRTRQGPDGF
jgi:hypothetical protein